jgi:hypothetical protein
MSYTMASDLCDSAADCFDVYPVSCISLTESK